MYIEFQLPKLHPAAGFTNTILNQNLHDWSDKYNIPYNKKIHKYKVRVTFDEEKLYDFFALTWNPKSDNFLNYLTDYRFVEPMNRV
jgi:hypothetical protein